MRHPPTNHQLITEQTPVDILGARRPCYLRLGQCSGAIAKSKIFVREYQRQTLPSRDLSLQQPNLLNSFSGYYCNNQGNIWMLLLTLSAPKIGLLFQSLSHCKVVRPMLREVRTKLLAAAFRPLLPVYITTCLLTYLLSISTEKLKNLRGKMVQPMTTFLRCPKPIAHALDRHPTLSPPQQTWHNFGYSSRC